MVAALHTTYPRQVSAHALFFQQEPSFRLEAFAIGWELTHGISVGAGPNGTLYYNDRFFDEGGKLSRDPNNPSTADFYIEQSREEDTLYVHIKFYAPDSQDKLLGEFIAQDPRAAASASGLLDERIPGVWRKADYSTASAVVSKASNSTLITITSPAVGTQADLHVSEDDAIYGHAIDDVHGQLTFKDLRSLQGSSKPVQWFDDHIVFNKDTDSNDVSAFVRVSPSFKLSTNFRPALQFLPEQHYVNNPLKKTAKLDKLSWKAIV